MIAKDLIAIHITGDGGRLGAENVDVIGRQLGIGTPDDGHTNAGIAECQQLGLGANGKGFAAASCPAKGNVLGARRKKQLLLFRRRRENEMGHVVDFM